MNSYRPTSRVLSIFMMAALFFSAQIGCHSIFHNGKPKAVQEPAERAKQAFYIGDVAVPYGLNHMKIEGVSLVTGLAGTGSDPPDSALRTMLLREMDSRNVHRPNQVLADPNTAMVVTTGYLKPGIQKGERFDILVSLPDKSETTSLRGGFMLESLLNDSIVTNRIIKGRVWGKAEGPILVEPRTGTEKDKEMLLHGRILSGGVCQRERPVILAVRREAIDQNRYYSMQIEQAINRRFQYLGANGLKVTVAKAKTDEELHLTIPPLYRDNLYRFIDVVRSLPLRETGAEQSMRLQRLHVQLLDPVSTARAALELEAIGPLALDTLRAGLDSPDVAVRFHSAQALAYLDSSDAAPILGKVALEESSYRYHALQALAVLNDVYAEEELRLLMNAPTAETRYGAFRAMTKMRPNDPLIKGVQLGNGTFTLCVIDTPATPMLHVTRSYRAEIVIFGRGMRFRTPLAVEGANNTVVRSISESEIMVSKFSVNEPDQRRTISTRVEDVIMALSDIGATYPDILEILQAAVAQNSLSPSVFRVDALPDEYRSNRYEKAQKTNEKKKNVRALADEKRKAMAEEARQAEQTEEKTGWLFSKK